MVGSLVLLLLISTLTDYFVALQLMRARGVLRRRLLLGVSLVLNLGLLCSYKYSHLLLWPLEALFGLQAERLLPDWAYPQASSSAQVLIPAGLSFYTFQTISYTLDVYRGRMPACRSLLDFALYVAFFPQLVAGPLVRARAFLPQLERQPQRSDRDLSSGIFTILVGLTKKLLIADVLGAYLVDPVYSDPASIARAGAPLFLLATYGFALQIYCDFSGYSDVALGSARLLGFSLPQNFDRPYSAPSLENFWTRWHISMSLWFYHYVYDALGANRLGRLRTLVNLFTVHILIGLWHGAEARYLLWGLWFAVWMVLVRIYRFTRPRQSEPARGLTKVLGIAFTFHVALIGGVLFRCEDQRSMGAALRALGQWSTDLPAPVWLVWLALLLGVLTHLIPQKTVEALRGNFQGLPRLMQGVLIALLIYLFDALAPHLAQPYVYFDF
jgi:D-alanyl-lipoteichoic acid acyltransferase DltB (MBOAT superfamily)